MRRKTARRSARSVRPVRTTRKPTRQITLKIDLPGVTTSLKVEPKRQTDAEALTDGIAHVIQGVMNLSETIKPKAVPCAGPDARPRRPFMHRRDSGNGELIDNHQDLMDCE